MDPSFFQQLLARHAAESKAREAKEKTTRFSSRTWGLPAVDEDETPEQAIAIFESFLSDDDCLEKFQDHMVSRVPTGCLIRHGETKIKPCDGYHLDLPSELRDRIPDFRIVLDNPNMLPVASPSKRRKKFVGQDAVQAALEKEVKTRKLKRKQEQTAVMSVWAFALKHSRSGQFCQVKVHLSLPHAYSYLFWVPIVT